MSGTLREAPPPGTPLKCALAGGLLEESVHSGVYLGGGRVAELNGDGAFRAVSLSGFLNGAAGAWDLLALRSGFRIYAACDAATGTPLASEAAAARAAAVAAAGKRVRYDLLSGNCHHFTAGCVSGRFSEGEGEPWMLERLEATVSRVLNCGRPVAWRPVSPAAPGFRYAPTPGKQLPRVAGAVSAVLLAKWLLPVAGGDVFGLPGGGPGLGVKSEKRKVKREG